MKSLRILDTQCDTGQPGQTARYKQVIEANGNKLKISIRDDSHKPQAYAKISRWDGDEWQEVHTIPGAHMQTEASYTRGCDESNFAADREKLIVIALDILS